MRVIFAKNHCIKIHLKELEMNNFKRDKFSNAPSEKEIIKNYDISSQYCDVCFIAFGSQEKRVFMDGKVAHLDCGNKVKS